MRKFTVNLLLLIILIRIPYGYAASADGITDLQLPDIQSETAVLMDADTGQVLYQKDMDKRMHPASITKIMTGMLALKYGQLSDPLTMSDEAVLSIDRDSSNIALDVGEQITLEQALYALSVASANDAANGIAEYIGDTVDGFIDMMNSEAKEMGAVNTHFMNANGLSDNSHYTTANDMALLTAEAIKMAGLTDIFNTRRYIMSPTNKQPETRFFNSSNRFVNGELTYEGTLMSKAGWTVDAQHTLVTAARRDGMTLIAVVLRSLDSTAKWSDTVALLDYGFDQFDLFTIPTESILQDALSDLTISDDEILETQAVTYSAQELSVLLPKGFSSEDIQISFDDPVFDKNSKQVKIPLRLSFASPDTTYIPEELVDTTLIAKLTLVSEGNEANPDALMEPTSEASVFKIILVIASAIIGVLLLVFLFLIVRRALIIRRRRRKRQARMRRSYRRF